MKRIIILFLVLFLSVIYSVTSLKTFEIEETEKLSLGLDVEDPDADLLIYTFTEPLDENGEWQTTYGDNGEYEILITVSDGETEVSEEVLVIVNRKEARPVIDNVTPEEEYIDIDEGNNIKFDVEASDPNNDNLRFEWKILERVVSNVNGFTFETGYEDAGEYTISLVISDGIFDISKEWTVNVMEIDLDDVLDQIKDITIIETETAILNLPDFGKYFLTYSISEPIGNDNEWKTDFDDAGEHTVIIEVKGKDFQGEKVVKVIVENKDRAPELVDLENILINENEQFTLELKAVDPDGDTIIFSVEDIPEGAELNDNIFVWTPTYDFVQKNNLIDYIVDKFRLLRKSVDVVFVAQSNELIDSKNIKISVKDINRPFVLEIIEDIEVDEGQEIFIDSKYNDPDKDKVSFSYSGFMNRNKKKTNFEDAGSYIVKVVATDGFHYETTLVNVKVNDVNRKPIFDKIPNVEIKEGEEMIIELSATDPDNDAVRFSAKGVPNGAKLNDNLFIWKPGFEVVNGTMKEFSVIFRASDGDERAEQKVKIIVLNANQAPKIISYSDNLIAVKDDMILFEVDAIDGDGDELTYSWDFGFFSKFEDGNMHQRIFTSTGNKKVMVTVSDGIDSVSKIWDFLVV